MIRTIIISFFVLLLASSIEARRGNRGRSKKIIGGREADPHEFPNTVAIVYYRNGQPQHWCGGSIISEHFVLTAAHCQLPDSKVIAGMHDYRDFTGSEQERDITEFFPHPGYKFKKTDHNDDIALIFVREPFNLNANVKKIGLDHKYPVGEVILAGWGYTKWNDPNSTPRRLKTNVMEALPISKCLTSVGAMPPKGMCYLQQRTTSCGGDSGTPVMQKVDGKLVQVGVSSFSYCDSAQPAGGQAISNYAEWIETNKQRLTEKYDTIWEKFKGIFG